jgi:ABC-type multidrug transport system fused ATPase/permease subunit
MSLCVCHWQCVVDERSPSLVFPRKADDHFPTQVLHACALLPDIAMLPDGEDTEIGATGINLSGGQRWRLTFARALYSRAGVLVLDDIFSAVDSHVGRHLLNYGILGQLGANRTRILVTHHAGLVDCHAAYIITLSGNGTASVVDRPSPKIGSPPVLGRDDLPDAESKDPGPNVDTAEPQHELLKEKPKKFVEDEIRAQGRVKWSVYKMYILASGGLGYWVMTFLMFSLAATSTIGRSYWLRFWTSSYADTRSTSNETSQLIETGLQPQQHQLSYYLGFYILISFISVALVGIKIIFVLVSSLRAARHLFEIAALNVLQAPLRWLDTQPIGRILNRFVGDFALIDSRLGGDILWCTNGLFSIVTIVASALFVSLWMSVPIVVLSVMCIYIVYLYLDAARDVKRLESSARSPIYELVGTVLSGLPTIRCFGRVDDYLNRMYGHIDRYAQSSWYILLATQWMKFRLGLLGVAFTFCIAAGVAYFPGIDASLAGFALSFALNFATVAETTISKYTATELDMNSMERILEYIQLETESTAGDEAEPSWPMRGHIIFRDLEVAYGEGLPPVLNGLNFEVPSRHRIGIVGRTGSGKSSLTLALFRFLQVRRGRIEIDGVDLNSLKLHDVRSRLAIIPQDPVLFSGTLRSNLDPNDEHTDVALLEVLARVSPTQASSREESQSRKSIFNNLQSSISRGGSNLSQGEKQLICLARAILTRPKILVLDEATSAVDMETDALIQRSIREEFRDSTVLVVAHRLSTVADFDKILVLSDGSLVEYDEPRVLAQRKGPFWEMVKESGEDEALKHLLT